MHLALRRYHTEIAILLIKYKCNVDIKDVKKQTALHLACSTNQKKVVDQLLKVGCDLNVQNVFNETPLHLSIKSNNLKIIRRLCASNCDLRIQNSTGCLPKDLIQSKQAYELEDNEEKLAKDQIYLLIDTLMNPIVKCKLIGMLKPVVNYYDKNLLKDLLLVQSLNLSSINDKNSNSTNAKNKNNRNSCSICNSTIDTTKRTTRCCNLLNQCIRTSDTTLLCCNSLDGIEQQLAFKQSTDNLISQNQNLISTIPKQLLKFNLKVLGECASGKSTLIETLKCGYYNLSSWFGRTTRTNRSNSNSSKSLNTNPYSTFNGNLIKSNGLSDKTVLSSISTIVSSKSSLDSNSNTPQSNSAINSINSSSILSINSDYLSSNNSSNLNLNNNHHHSNLNGNSNHSHHQNHHNHQNSINCNSNQFNLIANRKNSAINMDICNLKVLNKELSVSDGLHPFDCTQKDLNKFFASFDLLDSKFGLNYQHHTMMHSSKLNQANQANQANHKLDCTLGVNVQSINVPNVGDLTVWDFTGHPNYLQIYNKFLNDQDDSFYLICFNACDSFERQYTQLCYWLDLIKSCIHLNGNHLSFKGHLKFKLNVLIVATHRDQALKKQFNEISLKNLGKSVLEDLDRLNLRLSTNCLDNLNVLHCLLKEKYDQTFNLSDCICLLDARIANSNEIKLIKQHLDNYKARFAISLQPITYLLEEVIRKLTILRKQTYQTPIISFAEFVNLIRDQINILVEDEYLEFICLQLIKLGELIRLKNTNLDTQDLIIYDLKWLVSDVLGNLLNSAYLENNGKITGHYSVEDLQSLFPDIDALDLFLILENLELCTSCETEGNFLYLFPCFIQIGKPELSWQTDELNDDIVDHDKNENGHKNEDDCQLFNSNFTYIGLRIQCDDNCYPKHLLISLFPRIQILLERCFQNSTIHQQQNDDKTNELKLLHWCNGLRISYFDLEAIISLGFLASTLEFDSIEIKVKSKKSNRIDCFRLFELLVNLIEQFINSSFPSLPLQRNYYSPFELNCKRKLLYRYSTEELANRLFKDILNGECDKNENSMKECEIKNENCDLNENLLDIIACGLDNVEAIDFKSDNFLVNLIKEFFELFLINNNLLKNQDANGECGLNESNDENENEKTDDLKPTLITNFTVNDLGMCVSVFNLYIILISIYSFIDILTRQTLSKLFDPPDQFGFDWCMLSIKLNLTEKLPILDSTKRTTFTSPTLRLLEEFAKEPNCSLKTLLTKLIELNKKNAIELLFKALPLIKILPFKNSKLKPLLAYDSNHLNSF